MDNHSSFWKQQRVFVTGATGLVGGWLCRDLLTRGAQVFALVRDWDPQSNLFRSGDYKRVCINSGQLENIQSVERALVDHEITVVIHLAAQAIVGAAAKSPLQTFESNIRGTYNLLESCRRNASLLQAVVVASSDKAYGRSEVLPYVESMPLQGMAPYEVSKSCTDLLSQSYFHSFDLPIGIGRCGNIYGGGDLNWSRLIPATIKSCLEESSPIIRSDGTFVRDYIYVEDVSSAYLTLAECIADGIAVGEAFNFSPERALSVLEVVAEIQRQTGTEKCRPCILNEAVGEIHSQYLDSTRAKTILNWHPRFDFRTGITHTIPWYREFLTGAPAEATLVGDR